MLTVAIVILIALLIYYHLEYSFNYLSIDGFNKYNHEIMQFYYNYHYKFIGLFVIIYIIMIAGFISGTVILDVIAGFIFGVLQGSLLVIACYTIGSYCNLLIIRYFFYNFFFKRASELMIAINIKSTRSILMSIIGLRLIPIIPFWVINIIAIITRLSTIQFIACVIIGITPLAIIYAILGHNMHQVFSLNHTLTGADIMRVKIWLPLTILSLIIIIPNIYKVYKVYKSKL